MGIYDLLSTKLDKRRDNDECDFNGYLEDYISTNEDDKNLEVLNKLLEKDNDLKIIRNLYCGVSKESVSNIIIRYKDVFKLGEKAICVPYIVYGKKDDNQKAVILYDGDYVLVKGLYYTLTEPTSAYQEFKNDIVALTIDDEKLVLDTFDKLYDKRAGQIQRDLDKHYYSDYDASFEKAKELSAELGDDVANKANEAEDKEAFIKGCVSKWYLLKKYAYVQYMIDKDILKNRHEGNVKGQRNKAKENSDAIRFVSYSEMWKGKKE